MLQQPLATFKIGTMNIIAKAALDLFAPPFVVHEGIQDSDDALFIRSAKVDTAQFPNIYAIARAGINVNDITVDDATNRGVCVFNTPGGNARAVAELVITMIGAQARQLFKAIHFARSLYAYTDECIDEKVEQYKSKFIGHELAGRILGVVGLGRIGILVANLGLQKGMRVIGYNSFLTVPNALQLSKDVEVRKSLEQVLDTADVITLHVPLTTETRHLISAPQIERMRKGTILVNYARREVCDDEAVLAAIESGKLEAYLIDFPTKDFVSNPDVIPTPHLGESTEESEENCAVIAARQLKDFFDSGTIMNSVNFPTIEMIPDRFVKTRIVVVNRDVPNMIAAITSVLGTSGFNIIRSHNEGNGKVGVNLIDIGVDVPPEIVDTIRAIDDVLKVRAIPMNR